MFFKIKKITKTAKVPLRKSKYAAGYDLFSDEKITISKRSRGLVSTGIVVEISEGYYGRIAPRSGNSLKYGIETGAGVIDSDYRGEVKVILYNHSDKDFKIFPGDRIAQLILTRIITPTPEVIPGDLTSTSRGDGGFGSTGK